MRALITGGAGFIGSHLADRVVAYSRAKREGSIVEAEQPVPVLVRTRAEAGGIVAL